MYDIESRVLTLTTVDNSQVYWAPAPNLRNTAYAEPPSFTPTYIIHPNAPVPHDFDTPYERSVIAALRTHEDWDEMREAEYFEGERHRKREIEWHRVVQARAQLGHDFGNGRWYR